MLNKQGFEFLGTYRERMRICAVIRDLEVDMVEQDFMNEKRSAAREYEEQKVYLRDQLIHELEEKQRMIVSSTRFQNQIWLHIEENVVQCMRVAYTQPPL